jgi:hypothetical protein
MPSRRFIDESGARWLVWEVGPAWAERRSGHDRRAWSAEALERAAFERRHTAERRVSESDGMPHLRIPKHLVGGWLAFEGPTGRRRLSPIPPNWENATEAELASYHAKATVARLRAGPLTE